ncbi:LOW QUALITY PROTEIN: hypothetical protein TorRG33x02_077160 [Trema orientale]|uniref:Uncharacterized protein n=1 Tax=Trema orientale TaxID=63057 RepID=A0A2P5FF71_TREOI|nr:LOW QUALITY PROTEIN: hypothetical protein TorRG33x02_077160 [Trema orientale]
MVVVAEAIITKGLQSIVSNKACYIDMFGLTIAQKESLNLLYHIISCPELHFFLKSASVYFLLLLTHKEGYFFGSRFFWIFLSS